MLIQIPSRFAGRTDRPSRAARRAVFLLVSVVGLAGCAGLSVGPNGGPFPSPVTVDVYAGADIEIGSLRALVDGADKTSAFAWSGPGLRSLSATLTLAPGMHSVQATANVWNGLYRSYDPKSAQASFEAVAAGPPGSLSLAITPTSVAVFPGGTATIQFTVTRSGSFTGDVAVFDSDPIFGSGPTTTLPATDTVGTIRATARADALPGEQRHNVHARGMPLSVTAGDVKPLTFRIAHRPGALARSPQVARTAGQSALGPDTQTTLSVENGAPGTPRFEARFRRRTNSIGATIGFDPGVPSTGGAGFCPTGAVGFVLSGGSASMAHSLTLVIFEDAFSPRPFTITASAAGGAVTTPEIFFSRDCGVLAMVGADPLGQHAYRAQFFDVDQNRALCSLAFDAAPATLQAELLTPSADNQELSVTVGGQTTNCAVF